VGEKEEGWCPHRSQSVDSISWWRWWRWVMTGKLDITTDQQTLTRHQDHAADEEAAHQGILSFPLQQTYVVALDLPHFALIMGNRFYGKYPVFISHRGVFIWISFGDWGGAMEWWTRWNRNIY
jgi:hypothetical protein